MKKLEHVCSSVIRRIRPKSLEREKVLELAERMKLKVTNSVSESGLDAEVRIDGSVAKDTWLSSEADIDIFMRVSPTLTRDELETTCLRVVRKALKGYRIVERYAEHPYVEAWVEGTRVNVVPCYRVEKGNWKSATDRTPFHTEYMKSHLDEKLRDETRLLKKFMKGIGVYGAEIKVGGFSGMLCETLSLFYGTFRNTVTQASDWRRSETIDVERYYEGRQEETKQLFDNPLVVIDPVDRGRNAAAAVSSRRMWEFVASSRAFIQKPSLRFFYPTISRPFSVGQLRSSMERRGSGLLLIQIGKVDAVVDILWSQLYKTERSLRNLLQENDFEVSKSASWSDEEKCNIILFELTSATLSKSKRHRGPPVSRREESGKFLKKHLNKEDTVSGPWIEDDRWIVEKLRRNRSAELLLETSLSSGGRAVGVAGRVAESVIKRGFKILLDEEIISLYRSNRQFSNFLCSFLKGRPSWIDF